MKYLLYRFLIIAIALLAFNKLIVAQAYQYVPVVSADTMEWDITCFGGAQGHYANYANGVSMFGDSIVEGLPYKKLHSILDGSYMGLITETIDKKVYIRPAHPYVESPDTAFAPGVLGDLTFDFSLNVGDFFKGHQVQSVDTFIIAGSPRKSFNVAGIGVWIEGVGVVSSGLGLGCNVNELGYINTYLCQVKRNGIAEYVTSFCTSSIKEESEGVKIEVYPNPVANICNILVANGSHKSELRLYTSTGLCVSHQAYSTLQFEIDMRNLSPGIYFLQITDEQSNRGIKKIVKQ